MSLVKFLQDNGFYIRRWLRFEHTTYIDLLSSKKAVAILLAVPKSLAEEIPGDYIQLSKENVPKMSVDTVDDYTKTSEPFIEQTYNNITHHIDIPQQHEKPMSYHLKTSYKHPVVVDTQVQDFEFTKKLLVRQIGRLKYCVQGIPHRIGCINSTMCCILSSEHKVKLYTSPAPLRTEQGSKLYVIMDLSIFHDRIETIEDEAEQVLMGVYKILMHTQTSHVENIRKLIQRLPSIEKTSDNLLELKKNYMESISKFTELLIQWTEKQTKAEVEKGLLQEQYPDAIHTGMRRDHALLKLNRRIDKCKKARREIVETLERLRSDNEHLSLDLDYILFDNIVMVDKTIQNFNYLKKLEESLR